MKSFSQVVKEASAPKARVVLFGRMNPPTSGHEENVLAAHKVAQKHNAELHVVASHSQDAKKNPLTPAQKSTHLNRAFGHLSNTSISTSSAESPSILNQAAAAHKAGVRHFIMAGGGDRASSYHKLLKQYNGVQGKPHGFYKFDKISVANTGARKEGVSGTDMRKHAAAGDYAKFSQNLPSRIQSNPAHAKELFGHVQNILHKKEDIDRENYVQGLELPLGSLAEDIHSGLIGKVVYRGPTYVTLQMDEDLSFKRWIKDVEAVNPADLPEIPTYTFKGYVKESLYPADVKAGFIQSLHLCPGAQKEFNRLLDDSRVDQSIVLTALDSTAHYLAIEELAQQDPDRLDDHAVTQFVAHMRQAANMLRSIKELPRHEPYMEKHAHAIMNMLHGNDPGTKEESTDMDRFKNYLQEMEKTEKANIESDPHLSDKDLADIEKHIDQMEWEDVRHILHDDKQKETQAGDATDEELEADGDLLDEDLSALQRINKRFAFMKTKAKRQIARRIALKRPSNQKKLKKKAVVHARKLIKAKILRGRDYSKLSAAEKNRIENVLKRASMAVVRISNRLIPKIREVEMKRLKMQEQAAEYPTDVLVKHNTQMLAGQNPSIEAVPDSAKTPDKQVKKMKQFRKLEV
jgi:nicotinamide mononucleotide adenylyltransferase